MLLEEITLEWIGNNDLGKIVIVVGRDQNGAEELLYALQMCGLWELHYHPEHFVYHQDYEEKILTPMWKSIEAGKRIAIRTHSHELIEKITKKAFDTQTDVTLMRVGRSILTSQKGKKCVSFYSTEELYDCTQANLEVR